MAEKSLTLLVVDDDKRLRELLEKYLTEQGFWVLTAQNAKDARMCLQENKIDLIILDNMMPEESGLDFIQKLRTDPFNPKKNIPILMLTALSHPKDQEKGLAAGANDYVIKPFSPKELISRLNKILDQAEN